MTTFTSTDPIEKLHLSVRATNALHQAGLYTIGDLMDFPITEIPQLKNVGTKTASEITLALTTISSTIADLPQSLEPKPATTIMFLDLDGRPHHNLPIERIGLSNPLCQALHAAQIHDLRALQKIDKSALHAIPYLGKNACMICKLCSTSPPSMYLPAQACSWVLLPASLQALHFPFPPTFVKMY